MIACKNGGLNIVIFGGGVQMKKEDLAFLEEVLRALKESEKLEHLQNRSLIERAIAKVEFRLKQGRESSNFVEFSERSNSGRNKIGNIDGHS